MKIQATLLAGVLALGAGVAHAGNAGAGPGGTGSVAAGTLVAVESMTRALLKNAQPGGSAIIKLTAEQVGAIGSYLDGLPDTVASGTTLTTPTTFADGTRGHVKLDTASGQLTVQRF